MKKSSMSAAVPEAMKTPSIFDQTFQFIAVPKLDGTVLKVNKTAMDFAVVGEAQMKVRSENLEETNIALKVLLCWSPV
jgi:hypothetical protein